MYPMCVLFDGYGFLYAGCKQKSNKKDKAEWKGNENPSRVKRLTYDDQAGDAVVKTPASPP
jgi:hypothetical protein